MRFVISLAGRYSGDHRWCHWPWEFTTLPVVPLNFRGEFIGTITLRSQVVGAFGTREGAILERLANQIAPAVYNSQVYGEAKAEIEVVDELAKIITSTLDIDQVFNKFAEEMKVD